MRHLLHGFLIGCAFIWLTEIAAAEHAPQAPAVRQIAHLYQIVPWTGARADIFRLYSDGTVLFKKRGASTASGYLFAKLSGDELARLKTALTLTPEFLKLRDEYNQSLLSDQRRTIVELESGTERKSVVVSGYEDIPEQQSLKDIEVGCRDFFESANRDVDDEKLAHCVEKRKSKQLVPETFSKPYRVMFNFNHRAAVAWAPKLLTVRLTKKAEKTKAGEVVYGWPNGWPTVSEPIEDFRQLEFLIPGKQLPAAQGLMLQKKGNQAPLVKLLNKVFYFHFDFVYPDQEQHALLLTKQS
jgi:hypothetical protein